MGPPTVGGENPQPISGTTSIAGAFGLIPYVTRTSAASVASHLSTSLASGPTVPSISIAERAIVEGPQPFQTHLQTAMLLGQPVPRLYPSASVGLQFTSASSASGVPTQHLGGLPLGVINPAIWHNLSALGQILPMPQLPGIYTQLGVMPYATAQLQQLQQMALQLQLQSLYAQAMQPQHVTMPSSAATAPSEQSLTPSASLAFSLPADPASVMNGSPIVSLPFRGRELDCAETGCGSMIPPSARRQETALASSGPTLVLDPSLSTGT